MKKRIAIWSHGGIGAGTHAEGVPALEATLLGLAARADLSVYVAEPPRKPLPTLRIRHVGHMRQLFALPLLVLLFFWDHWRKPYTLIHAFYGLPGGRIACWLGRKLGIPVVVTFMGGEAAALPEIGYGHLREGSKEREKIKTVVREATAIVCLSEYQKQMLCTALSCNGANVHVIPFSVDPERFGHKAEQAPHSPARLIHIGNQNMVKDQATLLHAFALLQQEQEATLTMLGGDFLRGAIPTMAADLGLSEHITFAGDIPYDEVAAQLRAHDILLHSSLYEGQGLVYMEAMATGTAIVSTTVGLAADLPDACITKVPIGDAEAMATAITALLRDHPRRRAQEEAAHAWLMEHTLAHTIGSYLHLYQQVR